MLELTTLQNLIIREKQSIRKVNCKILKTIDHKLITEKLCLSLVRISMQDVPMTTEAGRLGRDIISGVEDLSRPEGEINKQRIDCGLQLLRILIDDGTLLHYRSKIDKHCRMISIALTETVTETRKVLVRGVEREITISREINPFVEAIYNYVPVMPLRSHHGVSFGKPIERFTFAHKEAGQLVRRINYANIEDYSFDRIPLAYRVINKIQQVPYKINTPLCNIYHDVQDDALFQYPNKNISPEMRLGMQRDNSMVLDIAKGIGTRTFYQYAYYCTRFRLYPAPIYLNHTGSKLAKSLFLLKNKKRLGKSGWYWLLLHCANVWGEDKLKLDDRVKFTKDNLTWMLEIANNPIEDRRWTEADDPFSFLAAILEIRDALNSGDKYNFKSGLPVGLDATNSGLQIFSALTRNKITGMLCNLVESDVIGDYYQYIGDYVWESKDLPEVWKEKSKDKRKIVKRSCMVFFYSAGKKTMGEHIWKDFMVKYDDITEEDCMALGALIYKECKKRMGETAKLMKVFVDMGMKAAKEGLDLNLTMPYTKAPFIQTYRDARSAKTELVIDSKKYTLRYFAEYNKYIKIRKVITSSSPNIIHSLDAQIVAAVVMGADYDLMCCHDCFYACPADVGKLYEDTRAAFVEIFEEDVLDNLLKQAGMENTIEYGDLDIASVGDNQYMFS